MAVVDIVSGDAVAATAATPAAAAVGVDNDEEEEEDGVVLTVGKIDLGKKGMVFVVVASGGCYY